MTEGPEGVETDGRWAGRGWPLKSLGGRLVAGASLLVVLAIMAAIFLGATILERFARGQIDTGLDARILAIASGLTIAPDGTPVVAESVTRATFDRPGPDWFWQVATDQGVARSSTLRGASFSDPPDLPRRHRLSPGEPWPADLKGPKDKALIARVSDQVVDGQPVRIITAVQRTALTGPLREMMAALTLSMAGLGLVLLGLVFLGVRVGLRPLHQLRTEVAAIRAGEAARLKTEERPSEVMPLVTELNTLLVENEVGLERARRNVSNLAHGLKTPLSTLSITLSEPGRDSEGVLAPLVRSMDRQIRHHLARARASALGGSGRARTDLEACLRDLAAILGKLHAERRIAFELICPAGLSVACEAQDLDELFGNLLDNAFAHARAQVRVTCRSAGRMVTVDIEDDGPGMTPAERDAVMVAGRRLDETKQGYGFGLSISAEIAGLYGGETALSAAGLGGLCATVSLPAAAGPRQRE